MRLTLETDYAFRIVSYLATHENEVIGAPKIAQTQKVSERFTLRILRKLNLAGITRAKRGAKGGYTLNKPKEEISLYDIILAVDGPIIINRCLDEDGFCSKGCEHRSFHCKFHVLLQGVQEELIEAFSAYTIDKFIQ
ncbi:MAG: Rrf2 family transcriptional regulator [Tissierellia bacterium]|nr:Rrf2 family transcriptional regulator [Tissierellia bacterium]